MGFSQTYTTYVWTPSAVAQAGSETTIAIYARAPSSTATAARGTPHGIMRASARTIRTLRAASACDVAIAHTATPVPQRHPQVTYSISKATRTLQVLTFVPI